MALHERIKFRKLCGVENGYIKNYIDRGKVIVREDGYIDDENPYNADFLRKQLDKLAQKANDTDAKQAKEARTIPRKATVSPIKNAKDKIVIKEKPIKEVKKEESKPEQLEINLQKLSMYELETQQKELTIEKTQNEIRMQLLREEKMRGELIPHKLMGALIRANNASVVSELKSFVDQQINIISIRKTLSGQEVAEIKGETYKAINLAMDKAVDITIDSLDRISSEFLLVKGND
jgi:hypothetical protein